MPCVFLMMWGFVCSLVQWMKDNGAFVEHSHVEPSLLGRVLLPPELVRVNSLIRTLLRAPALSSIFQCLSIADDSSILLYCVEPPSRIMSHHQRMHGCMKFSDSSNTVNVYSSGFHRRRRGYPDPPESYPRLDSTGSLISDVAMM